jgi:hypothetical protein
LGKVEVLVMPKYTRQHYIETANILKVLPVTTRKKLFDEYVPRFKLDNPLFDLAKFTTAVFGKKK